MSVLNLSGGEIRKALLAGGNRWKSMTQTIGATFTIAASNPPIVVLDPGGSGRTVLLPAEADGMFFFIANAEDVSGDLTVKEDSATTTIATVGPGDVQIFVCNGTTWFASSIDVASVTSLAVATLSATDSFAHGEDGTDLLGFYGATPVDRPAGAGQSTPVTTTVTAVPTTAITTAVSTLVTGTFGFVTSAQGDAVVAAVNSIIGRISLIDVAVNTIITNQLANNTFIAKLRTDLVELGLIKGSA